MTVTENVSTRTYGAAGALFAAAAVALGAFGAHGLRDALAPTDMEIYRTAALYHLLHAIAVVALAAIGTATGQGRLLNRICLLVLISIIIFSGSLYALVLTQARWLGAITPLGGLGFIVSWLWAAFVLFRSPR